MANMSTGQRPPVPFPPRPRAWSALVDRIVATAACQQRPVEWQPVSVNGMDHPWVGVQAPSLGALRAWQWDVVTPEDHDSDPLLRSDPLSLPIAQDMMVVDVSRADRPDLHVRLQVPVRLVPTTIDVSANALPPPPWDVELSTGWSAQAIAHHVGEWLRTQVGHDVAILPDDRHDTRLEPSDRFSIGEDLWVTDDAFDALLRLDTADAALVTGTLAALAEAMAPYR